MLKDIPNQENGKQLTRSSGSVEANYIEANEGLSKKRFCDEDKNFKERSQRKPLLADFNQTIERSESRTASLNPGSGGSNENFRCNY